MARYKLHCNGGSGNSYKVALYLNCAGLDWEPIGVDFAGGDASACKLANHYQWYGRSSGARGGRAAKVAIGRHLDVVAETTGKFVPSNAEDRAEATRWILSTIISSRTTTRCIAFRIRSLLSRRIRP